MNILKLIEILIKANIIINSRIIFYKTLKKVKLTIKGKYSNMDLEIGDYINTKILLQPIPKNNKISSFNFAQYYYFRQINAIGFVIGEI